MIEKIKKIKNKVDRERKEEPNKGLEEIEKEIEKEIELLFNKEWQHLLTTKDGKFEKVFPKSTSSTMRLVKATAKLFFKCGCYEGMRYISNLYEKLELEMEGNRQQLKSQLEYIEKLLKEIRKKL